MRVFATGPRKGTTFVWQSGDQSFAFKGGICEIPDNAPGLVQYLRVCLQIRTELEETPAEERTVVVETTPLRIAIAALDPNNDTHWNQSGQPAIDALTDFPNITRKQIEAAASDLNRVEIARRNAT